MRHYYYVLFNLFYTIDKDKNKDKDISELSLENLFEKPLIDKWLISTTNKINVESLYSKFLDQYLLKKDIFKNLKILNSEGNGNSSFDEMVYKIQCFTNKKAAELFYYNCENFY